MKRTAAAIIIATLTLVTASCAPGYGDRREVAKKEQEAADEAAKKEVEERAAAEEKRAAERAAKRKEAIDKAARKKAADKAAKEKKEAADKAVKACMAKRDPNPQGCPNSVTVAVGQKIDTKSIRWTLVGDPWKTATYTLDVADPTQAPPGQYTMMAWSNVPYNLADHGGDGSAWDSIREDYGDKVDALLRSYNPGLMDSVIARYCNSPLDYYRKNPSQVMGSTTSGAVGLQWYGTARPFPGCGAPRTPFPNLYLSNSIWPFGTSTLGAGYVAASVVAEDLGVREGDVVFAITEGGETSFVIGTAWQGLDAGARVFFVYNNPDDVLREKVIRSREVIDEPRIEKINLTTGPMAITGSTRMQATSIQICVMITLFEMALRHIFREIAPGSAESGRDPAAVPAEFLKALEATHSELSSHGLREQMAGILAMEEAVYRTGRKNCYFADALAIDVLTDTTERSPTFCIPAFRKFDDLRASESWSFLFMPSETSEKAWERLLKRAPRAVEWTEADVCELIGPELAPKQHAIMKDIGLKEILRFKIGLDGIPHRPFNAGDTATAIVTAEEMDSLTQPDGFYRAQIENAARAGARAGVIFAGDADEAAKAEEFVRGWDAGVTPVFLKLPRTDSFLSFAPRIGVKMLLNALSTCTMVRLGRVLGNVMIWVVPSNLKLIDRSTRYISQLSGTPYDDSCRMLFEAIEYVAPRVQAGQAYPSPVGVSVMRLRHGLSSEEAEKRLYQELES